MAKGFDTMHPMMESALRAIGIKNSHVTQTYGKAKASAGYHNIEGYFNGKPFSSCVDLTWRIADEEMHDKLVYAGYVPFFRDWDGNQHIHCVYVGAKDGNGNVTILSGPRSQIIDYIHCKDGLKGHKTLTGKYAPTMAQRKQIQEQYAAWAPHYATKVFAPEKYQIVCHTFFEKEAGTVRCDIDLFLKNFGYSLTKDKGVYYIVSNTGTKPSLSLPTSVLLTVEGDFNRGNIRQLANAIELGVSFEWAKDKTSCAVSLSYI